MAAHNLKVDLIYERYADGRYRVTCDTIPGFLMSGPDLDVIQSDLNEVVTDLLRMNSNFIVEHIEWEPTLGEIKKRLTKAAPDRPAVYVVHGKLAA